MKRWLGPILLAIAVTIAVPIFSSVSNNFVGYRLSGATLVDQALAPQDESLNTSMPPLASLVTRMAIGFFQDSSPFSAAAFVSAIATALAIAAVGLATTQLGGFMAGVVAVLLMLTFPGVLFHGRVAGPEAITMLAFSLLLWAGTRGANTLLAALLATSACLAALASHHEAMIVALPWLVAAILTAQRDSRGLSPAVLLPLLLAPLVLGLLWPYLGNGGTGAWAQAFIVPHTLPHAPLIVLGEIRNQAIGTAPSFFDGALLAMLRIPMATATLAVLGGVCILRACNRGQLPWQRSFIPLMCVSLIATQCLNGSPYYDGSDGTMRWLPAMAMMGGVGAGRLQLAVLQHWPRQFGIKGAPGSLLVLALILLPAAFGTARAFPMESSFYNAMVGGLQNAEQLGLESHTDIYIPAAMLTAINARLPRGARLAFQPATVPYRKLLDRLKEHGLLRADIESAEPYHATHLAVPRSPGHPAFAEMERQTNPPLFTVFKDGIRQLALYRY